MTEPTESSDLPSGDIDPTDSTADYDPDQDQDTEPSTMAPAGERPSNTDAGD